MKSYKEIIDLETSERSEYKNVTTYVTDVVRNSEIADGICLVSVLHTSAGIFINDDEAGLREDLNMFFESLVPWNKENYKHNINTGESNAPSHIKSILVGRDVTISISDGKLDLGTWGKIFFAEFDGPRSRKLLVKVIGV